VRAYKYEPREGEHKGNDCSALEDVGGLREAGNHASEEFVNPEREGSDDQKHGNLHDDTEHEDGLHSNLQ
jgi:hypothetical protein